MNALFGIIMLTSPFWACAIGGAIIDRLPSRWFD